MRSSTAGFLPVLLLTAAPILAADPDPRDLIEQARASMTAGDFAKASAAYAKAADILPPSPELAYDRGVAAYRQGEYDQAARFFTGALTTKDRSLEARAKFNLGNCAHAQALAKKEDPRAALELLRLASAHYRDAIEANPHDVDARANLELAHRLIQSLQRQNQQQQDQNQDSSDDKKPPQSRPSSQPSSTPSSRPEDSQENKSDQQNQDRKSQQQSQKGESEKQEGRQQQTQDRQAEQQERQEQNGKLETAQEGEAGEENKDQQQAQMIPAAQRSLTKEEAEKLLQLIRDKERRRAMMLQEMRRQQARQAPVDKDW